MTVAEISSNSDSQSGSSSDSSSDTLSSLGSVDLENEDDDEDLSVCSVDSDSQRRHRVNRKVKVRHPVSYIAKCFIVLVNGVSYLESTTDTTNKQCVHSVKGTNYVDHFHSTV